MVKEEWKWLGRESEWKGRKGRKDGE